MLKTIISTTFVSKNYPSDLCEHIGNVGLLPLRAANRGVKVSFVYNYCKKEEISRCQQITALVLSIILIPITLPMTIIGLVATLCSKSYSQKVDKLHKANSLDPKRPYNPAEGITDDEYSVAGAIMQKAYGQYKEAYLSALKRHFCHERAVAIIDAFENGDFITEPQRGF